MMDRSRWGIFLPKGESQKSKKEEKEKEKEKENRRASKEMSHRRHRATSFFSIAHR